MLNIQKYQKVNTEVIKGILNFLLLNSEMPLFYMWLFFLISFFVVVRDRHI
jgi:hypothetical protein